MPVPTGVAGGPPTPPMGDEPPSGSRTSWAVEIDIEGGEPPYMVQLKDVDDRTIGSARVVKTGRIRLNVRGAVSTVNVTVRDGTNRIATGKAAPTDANVSLNLGR